MIGGRRVRCISETAQLLFHQGYEPRECDRRDVALLCDRFGMALPLGYA
jgi:lincosamide nucleotidyltransferase A/C/D/E